MGPVGDAQGRNPVGVADSRQDHPVESKASVATGREGNVIKDEDLEVADAQLTSLLGKCAAVLRGSSLSPSRLTLMTNRVSALRTALELVRQAKARQGLSQ